MCTLVFFHLKGDWKFLNGHYYNYRGKLDANSWFSAESVCREHGETVHLVSIHSQKENDFINSLSSGEEEQWIGLTNHNSKTFKWIDRSAFGTFKHWAVGEPNQATIDEDCGAMKPGGTWIDVACRKQRLDRETSFDRRAFTCKTSGKNIMQLPFARERETLQKNVCRYGCLSCHTFYNNANFIKKIYVTLSMLTFFIYWHWFKFWNLYLIRHLRFIIFSVLVATCET